jgi:serine/threonine protein kinase
MRALLKCLTRDSCICCEAHRNVVALHEVIDDPEAQSMYLVMQYAEHGAVASQAEDGTVTPVAPRRLANFAQQLCAGLHYLHSHGVIHRDIKPENILLGGTEEVCLADFGISTMIDDGRTGISQRDLLSFTNAAARGTAVYLAPELLRTDRERSLRASDEPIDVWALGLSLYVLLFGRLPWAFESGPAYMRAVVEEDIEYPFRCAADPTDEDWLRDEWLVLLRGMLAKDEGKRLVGCTAVTQDALVATARGCSGLLAMELKCRTPNGLDAAVTAITESCRCLRTLVAQGSRVSVPALEALASNSHQLSSVDASCESIAAASPAVLALRRRCHSVTV